MVITARPPTRWPKIRYGWRKRMIRAFPGERTCPAGALRVSPLHHLGRKAYNTNTFGDITKSFGYIDNALGGRNAAGASRVGEQ